MQRLEITGATPEELYINAINLLSLFVRGAQQQTAPAVVDPPASEQTDELVVEQEVIPPKGRRGKVKPAEKLPSDEIPDLGVKTIEHEPQTLTLDGDIRPRLREIQQACTQRGMSMQDTISYIQKLYGPFGIAKAEQLKPEQFAEFLEMSDAYLSGEA